MRAMVLSWEYPPNIVGGLGQHVKELLPSMQALDPALELHIIAPTFDHTSPAVVNQKLTVHWVPVDRPRPGHFYDDVRDANRLLASAALRAAEMSGPFDVLHVHDWLASWAAFAVQDFYDTPLIATIHATERGRYRGHLHGSLSTAIDQAEAELCRRADYIITCSSSMKGEVEHYFDVEPSRVGVIPNGIDGSRFDGLREADLSAFRTRYARPDQPIVFNVGRLVYEKGADLLVEAVPAVLHEVPDTHFVIGGQGPLLARLQDRVRELNIEAHVTLAGFMDDEDRDRLYVAADCCVFPSRYEPFGIVALEAMAAGTPVVVADVGGLGSVVQHAKTGLKAHSENVRSLADAIIQVLNDPVKASLLAANALQQVNECLSWRVIAGMTLRLYKKQAG